MVYPTVSHNSHTLTIKKETHRKGSLTNKMILFTNQKKSITNKKETQKKKRFTKKKSHGK